MIKISQVGEWHFANEPNIFVFISIFVFICVKVFCVHRESMRADPSKLVGTFDETTFQCFLSDKIEGPLRIGVTPLGMQCVPLLGTYQEQYDPVISLVLLQTEFHPRKVPKVVADALVHHQDVSLFAQFHTMVPFSPCQHFTCDAMDEISVVLHAFYFPDAAVDSPNLFKKIQVGLFEPRNVEEVHQNPRDLAGSGIRFGELSERDVIIHDGCAFSPANCQLRRISGVEDWFSFWVVGVEVETGKSVASFHLICGTEEQEKALRRLVADAKQISDLMPLDPIAANVIQKMFF